MHESPVTRPQRLRRTRRLTRVATWRSLLLGLTDPVNDPHWSFIERSGTDRYLETPEPWLAPGASTYLARQLAPGAHVFEWGAGASTLWFISRGLRVTSYETDSRWAEAVRARAGGLADIRHVPLDESYADAPLNGSAFVLIDGRCRRNCAMHVAEHGSASTLVALDDSHRPAYVDGVAALSARASAQWHFPGLSEMMTPKLTSVFRLG